MLQSLRVCGMIVVLSATSFVEAVRSQNFFKQGDYVRAYHAAIQEKNVLMASQAAWAHCTFKDLQNVVWLNRGLKAARVALQKYPRNSELYIHLGSMLGNSAELRGVSVDGFNMAQESQRLFEKAVEISPNNPRVLMYLARWHSGAYVRAGRLVGGRPEKARSLATKALKLAPEDPTVLMDVAVMLAELKDPRANKFFKRALAIRPRTALERDRQILGKQIFEDLVK